MSREADELILHGSAVAIGGRGLLILGGSGAGKSGLALRLIAGGAALVADDRVVLARRGGALVARSLPPLAGLIEARGVGILAVDPVEQAELVLAVDLDRAPAARMPQRDTITYLGMSIELIFGREVPNLEAALTILMQNRREAPD